jgi:hypothetical protein
MTDEELERATEEIHRLFDDVRAELTSDDRLVRPLGYPCREA